MLIYNPDSLAIGVQFDREYRLLKFLLLFIVWKISYFSMKQRWFVSIAVEKYASKTIYYSTYNCPEIRLENNIIHM